MPWADDLSSCVTDVIASRPADPLGQLAHLLSQPSARPDWEETASAYAVRHNLEQQVGAALDAAGLTALQEEVPADAITRLCRELRRRAPSDWATRGVAASLPEGAQESDTVEMLIEGVESVLSRAISRSVVAHPEWRQAPPALSEVLQLIAKDV